MATVTQKVLNSSSLMLLTKGVQRGLGLASTLILARILTPDDFGLVAIIAIVLQFFEIMSFSGSYDYIVQKSTVNNDDVNTAWSIDIFLKSMLCIILVLGAPFIADFYDEPRIEDAFLVVSLVLVIGAAKNPGMMLYQRELRYKEIFWLNTVQKLFQFVTLVGVAYYFRSFWAFIIADIVAAAVLTIGTYLVIPYRPRLTYKKLGEQRHFSQWMLLKGVLGYTRSQIDTILVSRFFVGSQLGKYHMTRGLSVMPGSDLIGPAVEPLLAAFAQNKTDRQRLAYQVRIGLVVVCALVIPICATFIFFPGPIIDVLLGDQWTDTYDLLSVMSLLLFSFSFCQVFHLACISLGRVKFLFFFDLISLIAIFGGLYYLKGATLEQFAFARGALDVACCFCLMVYTARLMPLNIPYTLALIAPIVVASYLAGSIPLITYFYIPDIRFFELVIECIDFGIVYITVLLMFYVVMYRKVEEGAHIASIVEGIIKR